MHQTHNIKKMNWKISENILFFSGAACYGFPVFQYSVVNPVLKTVTLKSIECQV